MHHIWKNRCKSSGRVVKILKKAEELMYNMPVNLLQGKSARIFKEDFKI